MINAIRVRISYQESAPEKQSISKTISKLGFGLSLLSIIPNYSITLRQA
jgi:hypothetical protein